MREALVNNVMASFKTQGIISDTLSLEITIFGGLCSQAEVETRGTTIQTVHRIRGEHQFGRRTCSGAHAVRELEVLKRANK